MDAYFQHILIIQQRNENSVKAVYSLNAFHAGFD